MDCIHLFVSVNTVHPKIYPKDKTVITCDTNMHFAEVWGEGKNWIHIARDCGQR